LETNDVGKFLIVLAMIASAGFAGCNNEQRKQRKERVDQAQAELDRVKQALKDEVREQGEVSTATAEALAKKTDAMMEQLAASGSETEKAIFKTLMQCTKGMKENEKELERILTTAQGDRFFNMASAIRDNDFAWQFKLCDDYSGTSKIFLKQFIELPATLEKRLDEQGIRGRTREQFMKGFMAGFGKKKGFQRSLFEAHIGCAASYRKCLEFVDKNKDRITVEEGSDELVFPDDATLATYNKLLEGAVESDETLEEAIRQWAENQ